MEKKYIAILVLVLLVVLAIVPLICMSLWNWLMPEIFTLPEINYWQAAGLMLLSTCFFWRGGSSKK